MLSKTTMLRSLIATLSVAPLTVAIFAENDQAAGNRSMERTTPLRDFQVIELRRYTTREGEREHFAKLAPRMAVMEEEFFPRAQLLWTCSEAREVIGRIFRHFFCKQSSASIHRTKMRCVAMTAPQTMSWRISG